MSKTRTERDSMGAIEVPADAWYGAQTQRAVNNFQLSGLTMPRSFLQALALVKFAAADANYRHADLSAQAADAIKQAAMAVYQGQGIEHFPIDVFQTGSGTSTNMNMNEVLAGIAQQQYQVDVHPNDDVNRSQSSNDVIPTTIQVSTALQLTHALKPALQHLRKTIQAKAKQLKDVVKTGRTHLMDAMPLTFAQELSAWEHQLALGEAQLDETLIRLQRLPQGGTAIGTGINAPTEFASAFCHCLSEKTELGFQPSDNFFAGIAGQELSLQASSVVLGIATTLLKISNDLRWMNSGPLAGLSEISLTALQPGSSIMPGKVNPVIPEAVAMVAAQVTGNHTTITTAAQSGNFQLNVMLPVIAYNLLQSIELVANSCRSLADLAIKDFSINHERLEDALARNPILVTALNPVIGYNKAAEIAKQAYASGRPILEVAKAETDLSESELERLLDPKQLTQGGLNE